MAAISTVESPFTYRIQLVCFAAISSVGFPSGVALGLGWPWPRRALSCLSWIGAAYFAGSGLITLGLAVVNSSTIGAAATSMIAAVAIAVAATGVPFYLMAKALWRSIAEGAA